MKTFIAHLLCLIACLPVLADTLEQRLSEIQQAPGVAVAEITTDAQGKPQLRPMPGFDGWQMAEIRYLAVVDDAIQDNAIAVIVDPDGNALWHRNPPSPVTRARQAAKPIPVGTDTEIRDAINAAQNVALADKISIERGETSADVRGYIEVNGKLQPVHYYVAKNPKTGEWTVKTYDTEVSKELEPRAEGEHMDLYALRESVDLSQVYMPGMDAFGDMREPRSIQWPDTTPPAGSTEEGVSR